MIIQQSLPLDCSKRLGDTGDWDSPYSWPVRREFSRILHRPRPHVGIVYTERFLNSRPLTYLDDETKIIRAKAGAILRQVHAPVPKPSKIFRPYESLNSLTSHQLMPYGVPQHIYHQSFYNEPTYRTIGRGHLACIQYAGGKGYPRRKHMYSDENRNIRDEIKFRSYYNRTKNADPKTLATGFAWRLLHLPPKDNTPFQIYRHSRILPSSDSKEKSTDNKKSDEEKKGNLSYKKVEKTPKQQMENQESKNINAKDTSEDEPKILKDSKMKKKENAFDEPTNIKVGNSLIDVNQCFHEEVPGTDKMHEVNKEQGTAEENSQMQDEPEKVPIDQSIGKTITEDNMLNQEVLPGDDIEKQTVVMESIKNDSVSKTVEIDQEEEINEEIVKNGVMAEKIQEFQKQHELASAEKEESSEIAIEQILEENKSDNLAEKDEEITLTSQDACNDSKKTEDVLHEISTDDEINTRTAILNEEIVEVPTELTFDDIACDELKNETLEHEIHLNEPYTSCDIAEDTIKDDGNSMSLIEPIIKEMNSDSNDEIKENLESSDKTLDTIENSAQDDKQNVEMYNNDNESETSGNLGTCTSQIQEESSFSIAEYQDEKQNMDSSVYEEIIIQARKSSTTQITEVIAECDKPASLDEILINETDVTADEDNVEILLE